MLHSWGFLLRLCARVRMFILIRKRMTIPIRVDSWRANASQLRCPSSLSLPKTCVVRQMKHSMSVSNDAHGVESSGTPNWSITFAPPSPMTITVGRRATSNLSTNEVEGDCPQAGTESSVLGAQHTVLVDTPLFRECHSPEWKDNRGR